MDKQHKRLGDKTCWGQTPTIKTENSNLVSFDALLIDFTFVRLRRGPEWLRSDASEKTLEYKYSMKHKSVCMSLQVNSDCTVL